MKFYLENKNEIAECNWYNQISNIDDKINYFLTHSTFIVIIKARRERIQKKIINEFYSKAKPSWW